MPRGVSKKRPVLDEDVEKEASEIVGFDITTLKRDWKGKIKSGVEFKDNDLQHISTGSIKLDWALGLPFLEGSMVEVYGPEASGKTTLSLELCKNAMDMGKPCFYIDLEYKLREAQLNMIEGFDRSRFTIIYPDNGEEALNIMHQLIMDFPGCLIILDSVGGLLPEVEDAEKHGKQTMGTVARLCHQMIRKLTGINSRNKCVIVFLNHLTATMAMFGKSETTHGGRAIKNRAAQRIELKVKAADAIVSASGDKIGQHVQATVVKNNVNRPHISVKYPIIYGEGINRTLDILEFARDLGLIMCNKGWYTINPGEDGEKKMRESEVLKLIKNDEEFKKSLFDKVESIFK